ncbi:HAMP domain-containing histidine kinase [Reichenbachiella carrageenanivorans]|uniref:histidine kinase n=1 Tax=Reichenbachiella carrageenanivorans TaxID=2979869 RepID=A0ABY6CZQ1_9BACT|nr:HAMP domain-containing sensor histidine kinase [Reichenbachiella carrageenanivorans]UXX78870.1 HAMP domain-containing histidine kinase [Reichenbachiella carrageenanivorans]
MKVSDFIDYFIHPNYYSDLNLLRKARLFIRACFLTSLFSHTYVWLSVYFEYEKGVELMVFNVVGFCLLPFLSKTRLPITFLGNIYVLLGAVAVFVLTYFSGGLWSAIYPWIVSIPVLAILVVNRLSGLAWGGISYLVMQWFGMMALEGKELPVEYNPEMRTAWFASILPGLLLMVLFIAYVFETIQRKALQELEEKNVMLNQQKETIGMQSTDLQKHVEEKEYIIRILAHDLKGPLNNISGLVAILAEEKDPELRRKYEEMISQSANKSQDLINRVLEMELTDQKNLKMDGVEVRLKEVLESVVSHMEMSAHKKEIAIKLGVNTDQDLIHGDGIYLPLIFENLISNAIKFSESKTEINIEINVTDTHAQVIVKDQGPGISKNEQLNLFKKFTKLSARPTDGESSSGLGLSLVKRYAELLNGRVWYEGDVGKGSIFGVEFPVIDT